MFLHSINILDTDMCVQEPGKYIAYTKADADMTELLPYMNTILRFADYNQNACSIKFKKEGVEFTIIKDCVNIAKFVNRTELHELLDWITDFVNDIHDSREEIEPSYVSRQPLPVLSIYTLLPKTNCRQCGEPSCMTFAAKLNKIEAEPEDCPVLAEPKYQRSRLKLAEAFA